jgi:hypothetical protein
MASLMDGANLSSISEMMKHYSLNEDRKQNFENNGTKNGQIIQNVGPHVTLVRIIIYQPLLQNVDETIF